MIRPDSVNKVLSQTNTGGIRCTLLLNKDGNLVCSAGSWNGEDPSVLASAVSGLWTTYEKARRSASSSSSGGGGGGSRSTGSNKGGGDAPCPKMTSAVLEYGNGLVGLSKIEGTSTLVCCLADASEEMGLVRRKVVTVAECLKESM